MDAREAAVAEAIAARDGAAAVAAALENPPLGTKDATIKVRKAGRRPSCGGHGAAASEGGGVWAASPMAAKRAMPRHTRAPLARAGPALLPPRPPSVYTHPNASLCFLSRLQQRNAALVARAFAAVKDAEIEAVVSAMTPDQADTAMKYVYKGLEGNASTSTAGSLFKWHAKLVEKSGLGCIVRTMTDRKTV